MLPAAAEQEGVEKTESGSPLRHSERSKRYKLQEEKFQIGIRTSRPHCEGHQRMAQGLREAVGPPSVEVLRALPEAALELPNTSPADVIYCKR